MNIQTNGYLSIEQVADQYLNQTKKTEGREQTGALSFRDIMIQKSLGSDQPGQTGELKFSKHALNRLNDRNIELDSTQLERLKDGTDKADQKGIRDSLVMVDQLAFIVNVPNRTVITAMDSTATDENIFTNINGAVIA